MTTPTLTTFLLARIAEDEARARLADGDRIRTGVKVSRTSPIGDLSFVSRFDPARVLAECVAKRRIVNDYTETLAGVEKMRPSRGHSDSTDLLVTLAEATLAALERACHHLALPYADHPDFPPV